MVQSVRERVVNAFPDDLDEAGRKEALEYLKDLRSASKDLATSLNRTALLTLAVMAIFELLTASDAKQVSIAGFVLEDLSFIYKFLPVIGSYVFLELIIILGRYGEALDVHGVAFSHLQPRLSESDLDVPLIPIPRAFFPVGSYPSESNRKVSSRIIENVTIGFAIVVMLLPAAFVVQAAIVLADRYGVLDIAVLISMLLSVMILAAAYTVLARFLIEDSEDGGNSSTQ